MKNLLLILVLTLCNTFTEARDSAWKNYQSQVLLHQPTLPGWCSLTKSREMMNLIYEVEPEICVEIGVFGGSSIYPTACALKFLKKGLVYAIDPWDKSACLQGYEPNDPNYVWWGSIDLECVFSDFLKMMNHFQLTPYCQVIRTTGLLALHYFDDESIDILHIDGNHSENLALSDVEYYFPKVKKGGYIWLDDTNWSSVSRAQEFLMSNCTHLKSSELKEYALFRK